MVGDGNNKLLTNLFIKQTLEPHGAWWLRFRMSMGNEINLQLVMMRNIMVMITCDLDAYW